MEETKERLSQAGQLTRDTAVKGKEQVKDWASQYALPLDPILHIINPGIVLELGRS